jgi:hypothetical protein
MDATVAKIRFGKHKGTPVGEVPTDYLAWVMRTVRTPPLVVKQELQRRSSMAGQSAILAASALSDRAFRDARKRRCKRHRRGCGVTSRAARRPEEQRQKSHEQLSRLGRGARITGEDYERVRSAWEATGGDPSECPFTCDSTALPQAALTLQEHRAGLLQTDSLTVSGFQIPERS